MACMNDYKNVTLKCSYQPCGHEITKNYHKFKVPHTNDNIEFCPKCKLFTMKAINSFHELPEFRKALENFILK